MTTATPPLTKADQAAKTAEANQIVRGYALTAMDLAAKHQAAFEAWKRGLVA